MTAGSKVGFQPQPTAPSDIESYREYDRNQVSAVRNIFFNDTRFKKLDKKSMDKIYNERNRNRRITDYVYK